MEDKHTPRRGIGGKMGDESEASPRPADGGAAFPSPEIRGYDGVGICAAEYGMSLRDYFAAKAMQGILAGPCSRDGASLSEWSDIPEHAYRIADIMLARRAALSKAGV